MPNYLKGNIFEKADKGKFELAVILGHRGLNVLGATFDSWLRENKSVADSFEKAIAGRQSPNCDPFSELTGPHQYAKGNYIWFFRDSGGGMSEPLLRAALEEAVSWAAERKLKSAIINGIKNVDGVNDDEQRIRFMRELVNDLEQRWHVELTLISSDDSFTSMV